MRVGNSRRVCTERKCPSFKPPCRSAGARIRPHPADGPRGGVVAAHFGNTAPQFGTHRFDEIGFLLDENGVADGKAHNPASGVPSRLFTGASTPDDGQIDADRLHPLFLIAAESLAQSDQQDHRSDAPDDPEHGQEAAHFVRPDGTGRLPQDLPDIQARTTSIGPVTPKRVSAAGR